MPLPFWRDRDLDEHLKSLGVGKGDDICVHSKLISFGRLESGVAGVYQALRRAVGEEGTIVLPSFTFETTPNTVFSVFQTKPQGMGSLSDYVWTLKEKYRSPCPIHSHMAIGPKASIIGNVSGLSSIGPGSDFQVFLDNDFHLLMLGLSFTEGASYMHFVEYCARVPYRGPLNLPRKVQYQNGNILDVGIYYYGRPDEDYRDDGKCPAYLENYDVVEHKMIEQDLIVQKKASFGLSSYCTVANAHVCAMKMVKQNPYAMVTANPKLNSINNVHVK